MFYHLMTAILFTHLSFSVLAKKPEECAEPSIPPVIREIETLMAPASRAACPDPSKLFSICNSLIQKIEDKDKDSPYVYEYQRKIMEASCADYEKDSPEEIKRKVNIMWEKHQDELKCNVFLFPVPHGSILKLAVTTRFLDVLEDAAQGWKVDLNKVDESDNRTVLDFVKDQMTVYKDNPANFKVFSQYYMVLRKAGAKHKSELE